MWCVVKRNSFCIARLVRVDWGPGAAIHYEPCRNKSEFYKRFFPPPNTLIHIRTIYNFANNTHTFNVYIYVYIYIYTSMRTRSMLRILQERCEAEAPTKIVNLCSLRWKISPRCANKYTHTRARAHTGSSTAHLRRPCLSPVLHRPQHGNNPGYRRQGSARRGCLQRDVSGQVVRRWAATIKKTRS